MDNFKRFIPKPVRLSIMQWVNQYHYLRKLRRATPVLVYQMGKVGSYSIYQSLLKQYPGVVLHSHNFLLNHEQLQLRHLYYWAILKAQPLKVISLTREPIGRNVSAFFENFERDTGVPYANASFSIEELKEIFLSKYRHKIPLRWFDNNILENFGIDVYSTPFPENGIQTYSHNNIMLLVMRSEINDCEKIKAIGDFLGLERFTLQNTNKGDEKDYSLTYKAFKNEVKFPPSYIGEMCESKYFNHFYGKDVIMEVRKKWSER